MKSDKGIFGICVLLLGACLSNGASAQNTATPVLEQGKVVDMNNKVYSQNFNVPMTDQQLEQHFEDRKTICKQLIDDGDISEDTDCSYFVYTMKGFKTIIAKQFENLKEYGSLLPPVDESQSEYSEHLSEDTQEKQNDEEDAEEEED